MVGLLGTVISMIHTFMMLSEADNGPAVATQAGSIGLALFATALGLLIYYRKTWMKLFGGLGHQLAAVPAAGVSSLWRLNEPDTDP